MLEYPLKTREWKRILRILRILRICSHFIFVTTEERSISQKKYDGTRGGGGGVQIRVLIEDSKHLGGKFTVFVRN
jgi:hypothetical protein